MYQFVSNVSLFKVGSTPHKRKLTFIPGQTWLNIYFAPGSASFTEPKTDTPHGPLFNQLLKIRFPEDTADSIAELEKMDVLPVVIKIVYSDASEKLIGSPGNPAHQGSNFVTNSDQVADEITFMCAAQHRAYLLEEAVEGEVIPEFPPES